MNGSILQTPRIKLQNTLSTLMEIFPTGIVSQEEGVQYQAQELREQTKMLIINALNEVIDEKIEDRMKLHNNINHQPTNE